MSIPLFFSAVFSGANAAAPVSPMVSPYKNQALLWAGWASPESASRYGKNNARTQSSAAPMAASTTPMATSEAFMKKAGASQSWLA